MRGATISFRVPPRATYARVTASAGEGLHHLDGEQFAWTQPFWVSVDGEPRSSDPRHAVLETGWRRLRQLGVRRIARELFRAEAEANLRARREPVVSEGQSKRTVQEYYDLQLPTYLKVWGEDGRIGWGYFASPSMGFKDAQQRQMERLAEMGGFDERSVILDLGCGAAINCFYLVRRFGCRVVGLEISSEMIRKARSLLATSHMECFDRLSFFDGPLASLVRFLHKHDASERANKVAQTRRRRKSHLCSAGEAGGLDEVRRMFGEDVNLRAPFTHLWSTCTNWFIPLTERKTIFSEFARIATADARLVMDDCLCPNKVISHRSQLTVYDRLSIEPLWNLAEYKLAISGAGFLVDECEDLTLHCQRSYEWLSKSAARFGEDKLTSDYMGTVDALKKGDLAWYLFTATRATTSERVSHSLS